MGKTGELYTCRSFEDEFKAKSYKREERDEMKKVPYGLAMGSLMYNMVCMTVVTLIIN